MMMRRYSICALIAALTVCGQAYSQSHSAEGWKDLSDYESFSQPQSTAPQTQDSPRNATHTRPSNGARPSTRANGAANTGWRDLDSLLSTPNAQSSTRGSSGPRNPAADSGWKDLDSLLSAPGTQSPTRNSSAPRNSTADSGWRDLDNVDPLEGAPATPSATQQRRNWSQTQLNVWTVEDSAQSPTGGSAAYLFAGDTLDIDFKDAPALSGEYALSDTGTITLPLIGTLRAHGQSAEAFEVVLEQVYGVDYLVDPDITISRRASVIGQITLSGLVRAPGAISVTKPQNLAQILGRAGGVVGGNAAKDAVITRRKNGEVYARSVSLDRLSAASNPGLMLLPGDTVNIIERSALPDMQAASSRFPRLDNVLSGGSAINF